MKNEIKGHRISFTPHFQMYREYSYELEMGRDGAKCHEKDRHHELIQIRNSKGDLQPSFYISNIVCKYSLKKCT
jgi:hypothetical protein